jgi:hypothetical protein
VPTPAVGRQVRLEPKDWGSGFVQDLAAGNVLALPVGGYYTATITAVDGRGRAPVRLELREFEPTEVEERGLDFVRSRLILNSDEDPWRILPGKGAPKRVPSVPVPERAAQHVPGVR